MSLSWERTTMQTAAGAEQGIAPLIISASRATDIPAFHGEWFMNRLKAGYVKWTNPFNASRPQYVAFKNARVIVFWTKNAIPFETKLDDLDKYGINYYFTYTINDYEAERFEPNVPELKARIDSFKRLAKRLGKERVIWRFDPLILTDSLGVRELLKKVEHIGDELAPFTEKLVFSFADISVYKRVERSMATHSPGWRSFSIGDMQDFAAGLAELNQAWQLELATCGEETDLSQYGIKHNSCIDGSLMLRLFPHDHKMRDFLLPKKKAAETISLFSEESSAGDLNIDLKDTGQRESCGCIVSKDIGQYNTCSHLCVYCYANYSRAAVSNNMKRIKAETGHETIIPSK